MFDGKTAEDDPKNTNIKHHFQWEEEDKFYQEHFDTSKFKVWMHKFTRKTK